ncbi:MAG: hypothetical protein F6K17_07555 [Okeania sp. SIO3C4]|nr:hypothetical protein [Okeania sp. SIO3C4]
MTKYTSWIKYLPLGITLIAQPAFGTCSSLPVPSPAPLGDHTNIPLPTPNLPHPCNAVPTYTSLGGTWVGTGADLPWRNVGTFNVTGSGTTNLLVGTTTFDFVTNPLPVGTYFDLGDIDNGTRTRQEQIILKAFDTSGNLITTNWLSEPFRVFDWKTGLIPPPGELPSSSFSSGTYTIDGKDLPGNPSVVSYLTNLEEIGKLVIQKNQGNNGLILRAPITTENPTDVPETTSLLGLAVIGLMGFIYRRKC